MEERDYLQQLENKDLVAVWEDAKQTNQGDSKETEMTGLGMSEESGMTAGLAR